ncbi:MAG: hypothetical protein KatS3mg126_1589 [Lysobacteraceae bacterium]|nr:MAG: hypothetical protein KatS3mg126_1589 [Xanthomonadaceae bacterium]
MSRIDLKGVNGSNPLGFLATLGLLRILPGAKLGFCDDGSYQPFVEGLQLNKSDLAALVFADAKAAENDKAPWRFTYTKPPTKKRGEQVVADLKPPPNDPGFAAFFKRCLDDWLSGKDEGAAYAAAYFTDVAVDSKGNTKPTAFHFTAANQTFLGQVESIRASLTQGWVEEALFTGRAERSGSNLRWDPAAERSWALMAEDPNKEGTRVNAPLEWLAFRGLPLLPSFPQGSRIVTTGVSGRGDDMTFTWPLWSVPASMYTARSVLQVDWTSNARERAARSIFAICSSSIRRTSQGFGNLSPSSVEP